MKFLCIPRRRSSDKQKSPSFKNWRLFRPIPIPVPVKSWESSARCRWENTELDGLRWTSSQCGSKNGHRIIDFCTRRDETRSPAKRRQILWGRVLSHRAVVLNFFDSRPTFFAVYFLRPTPACHKMQTKNEKHLMCHCKNAFITKLIKISIFLGNI